MFRTSCGCGMRCEGWFPGSVIGQALTDHMDVRKVGFTGSTEVGKEIMRWLVKKLPTIFCESWPNFFFINVPSCAVSNAKRVSLELGGKSPLIIFGDCDMEKAVRQVSNWLIKLTQKLCQCLTP